MYLLLSLQYCINFSSIFSEHFASVSLPLYPFPSMSYLSLIFRFLCLSSWLSGSRITILTRSKTLHSLTSSVSFYHVFPFLYYSDSSPFNDSFLLSLLTCQPPLRLFNTLQNAFFFHFIHFFPSHFSFFWFILPLPSFYMTASASLLNIPQPTMAF